MPVPNYYVSPQDSWRNEPLPTGTHNAGNGTPSVAWKVGYLGNIYSRGILLVSTSVASFYQPPSHFGKTAESFFECARRPAALLAALGPHALHHPLESQSLSPIEFSPHTDVFSHFHFLRLHIHTHTPQQCFETNIVLNVPPSGLLLPRPPVCPNCLFPGGGRRAPGRDRRSGRARLDLCDLVRGVTVQWSAHPDTRTGWYIVQITERLFPCPWAERWPPARGCGWSDTEPSPDYYVAGR